MLACLVVAMSLALWLVGRVVSDRVYEAQFLAWIPTWAVLLPAAAACGALPLARAGRWRQNAQGQRTRTAGGRVWLGIAVLLYTGLASALLWAHLVEFRLLNALSRGGGDAPRLRIVHWNMEAFSTLNWRGDFAGVFPEPPPDVIFLTSFARQQHIERALAQLGREYTLIHRGGFTVASVLPMRDAMVLSIPVPGTSGATPAMQRRFARVRGIVEEWYNRLGERIGLERREFRRDENAGVLAVTIDARSVLGRELRVRFIDVPSDPMASRWENALAMAQGMRSAGLEPADIVLGDTNTPRGGASLELLAPGMHHAYDDAGFGPMPTWPRASPLLHIDQVFLSPSLRALRYEVIMSPSSDHLIQYAEIGVR
ncbi:MAG: endonuclease/exonuclease/phosphatase family protein [Phycisphaerales bacterium]